MHRLDQHALSKEIYSRFTLFGILFGFCFPLMAISLDLTIRQLTWTWESLAILHRVNPLHWIIDSAPVVLGATAWMVAHRVMKREQKIRVFLSQKLQEAERISEYTQQLLQGNFDARPDLSQENQKLAASLIQLRDNLKRNKIQEQESQWANQGLAQFIEILRQNEWKEIAQWSKCFLPRLVAYLEACQAGLFVMTEQEYRKVLELKAAYAFDLERLKERTLSPGEGLVGQCFRDQKSHYLRNLPRNYTSLSSSFLKLNPNHLLLIPLKANQRVLGVLEMSFVEEVPDYQIRFLEKLGEMIAHTLDHHQQREGTVLS